MSAFDFTRECRTRNGLEVVNLRVVKDVLGCPVLCGELRLNQGLVMMRWRLNGHNCELAGDALDLVNMSQRPGMHLAGVGKCPLDGLANLGQISLAGKETDP